MFRESERQLGGMIQIEFQFLRLAIAQVNQVFHGGPGRTCGVEMKASGQRLRGCEHDMAGSSDYRTNAPVNTKSDAIPRAGSNRIKDDFVAKRRVDKHLLHGVRLHAASGGSVAANSLASLSGSLAASGIKKDRCLAGIGAVGDPARHVRIRARCMVRQRRMRSAVPWLRVGRQSRLLGFPKRRRSGAWKQRAMALVRGRNQEDPASSGPYGQCVSFAV